MMKRIMMMVMIQPVSLKQSLFRALKVLTEIKSRSKAEIEFRIE